MWLELMHLSLSARLLLKLLTALFISVDYSPGLNWTLICSSVTFHQPWHVVFDVAEWRLSANAFQMRPGEVQPCSLDYSVTHYSALTVSDVTPSAICITLSNDSTHFAPSMSCIQWHWPPTNMLTHTHMFSCLTSSVSLHTFANIQTQKPNVTS